MNPENVVFCVLKTQVNWTLVRFLLVRNSKIRIQIKAYKRKAQATYPCPAERMDSGSVPYCDRYGGGWP